MAEYTINDYKNFVWSTVYFDDIYANELFSFFPCHNRSICCSKWSSEYTLRMSHWFIKFGFFSFLATFLNTMEYCPGVYTSPSSHCPWLQENWAKFSPFLKTRPLKILGKANVLFCWSCGRKTLKEIYHVGICGCLCTETKWECNLIFLPFAHFPMVVTVGNGWWLFSPWVISYFCYLSY